MNWLKRIFSRNKEQKQEGSDKTKLSRPSVCNRNIMSNEKEQALMSKTELQAAAIKEYLESNVKNKYGWPITKIDKKLSTLIANCMYDYSIIYASQQTAEKYKEIERLKNNFLSTSNAHIKSSKALFTESQNNYSELQELKKVIEIQKNKLLFYASTELPEKDAEYAKLKQHADKMHNILTNLTTNKFAGKISNEAFFSVSAYETFINS